MGRILMKMLPLVTWPLVMQGSMSAAGQCNASNAGSRDLDECEGYDQPEKIFLIPENISEAQLAAIVAERFGQDDARWGAMQNQVQSLTMQCEMLRQRVTKFEEEPWYLRWYHSFKYWWHRNEDKQCNPCGEPCAPPTETRTSNVILVRLANVLRP